MPGSGGSTESNPHHAAHPLSRQSPGKLASRSFWRLDKVQTSERCGITWAAPAGPPSARPRAACVVRRSPAVRAIFNGEPPDSTESKPAQGNCLGMLEPGRPGFHRQSPKICGDPPSISWKPRGCLRADIAAGSAKSSLSTRSPVASTYAGALPARSRGTGQYDPYRSTESQPSSASEAARLDKVQPLQSRGTSGGCRTRFRRRGLGFCTTVGDRFLGERLDPCLDPIEFVRLAHWRCPRLRGRY